MTRTSYAPGPTVQETLQSLETGVRAFCQSDTYKTYLRTMSKFHKYSYNNSLLIAMQKPDATYLAGYAAWNKNFHRHVRKGEHGIRILAPMSVKSKTESDDPNDTSEKQHLAFRLASVFDISQTEGEPLPDDGVRLLTGAVDNYPDLMRAIRGVSEVPITFENIPGSANGYYSRAENRIVIESSLEESQAVKTAVHELAHSILHSGGDNKDRGTKEVEAESTAFCVCDHFGLDTGSYSFGYIAGWSAGKDLPELKASFQTIHDTASFIITNLEEQLAALRAA